MPEFVTFLTTDVGEGRGGGEKKMIKSIKGGSKINWRPFPSVRPSEPRKPKELLMKIVRNY